MVKKYKSATPMKPNSNPIARLKKTSSQPFSKGEGTRIGQFLMLHSSLRSAPFPPPSGEIEGAYLGPPPPLPAGLLPPWPGPAIRRLG